MTPPARGARGLTPPCAVDVATPTPAPELPEKLITNKELAAMIGVVPKTIRAMVARGQLPAPIPLGPRCHRWRLSEVMRHLDLLRRSGWTGGDTPRVS